MNYKLLFTNLCLVLYSLCFSNEKIHIWKSFTINENIPLKENFFDLKDTVTDFKNCSFSILENSENYSKYQQIYKDIKVNYATLSVIKSQNLSVISGIVFRNIDIDVNPKISIKKAIQTIEKNNSNIILSDSNELVILPIFENKDENHNIPSKFVLVYCVPYYDSLSDKNYISYVNAHTAYIEKTKSTSRDCETSPGRGKSLYNGEVHFKTRYISFPNYTFSLRDDCRSIHTVDANNKYIIDANNYFENQAAVSAHWGVTKTHDYFLNNFNRKGLDNYNKEINVYPNYGLNNASYAKGENIDELRFGDGIEGYNHFASLDIVAHEFTHGVTEYTSSLDYKSESGALNESFSDIFGLLVQYYVEGFNESRIYNLGEDSKKIPRNFKNPHLSSPAQPKIYLNDPYWHNTNDLSYDHGGVHINSGVQNHWFYLLSNGGTTNNIQVTGIGLEKAGKIAYLNLTKYLHSLSNFEDAKNGSIYAAMEIFGACSNEVVQVVNAWNAVGVSSGIELTTENRISKFSILFKHIQNQTFYNNSIGSSYLDFEIEENPIIIGQPKIETTNTVITAGKSIDLKPGFSCKKYFTASINRCLSNNMRIDENTWYYGGKGSDSYDSFTNESKPSLSISPNPVKSGEQIYLSSTVAKATIMSLDGSILSVTENTNVISTENLSPGLYFIKTENETLKLIVE